MPIPEIEFIINPDGTVEVDGKNFAGPDCEDKIRAYLKALGEVKQEKKKDDIYRVVTQQNQSQSGRGTP